MPCKNAITICDRISEIVRKPSSSKSNSLLEYQVITQFVVTIDSDNCSLATVSNLVQQQIGFEAMLLDSKCFSVMESDTTNSMEFWKLNRRILAASKELYDKLKVLLLILFLLNSLLMLREKRQRLDRNENSLMCLKMLAVPPNWTVIEGIELKKTNELIKVRSTLFEYIICKDVMQSPQFSPCCNRLISCHSFMDRLMENHNTCPHCSARNVLASGFRDVRGINEFLDHV